MASLMAVLMLGALGGPGSLAEAASTIVTYQSGGNNAELILYPPYGRNGHRLFFEVGHYWKDLERFLRAHLQMGNA